MEKYINDTKGLISFIENSPSCYHVIDNIKKILYENGYTELSECEDWIIENGKRYFVIRGGSSIIAFNMPQNSFESFMICAAHSDSPTFKIKPDPEIGAEGAYLKLNTEKYGGMIMQSWLDRPLSIAGRAVINTDDGIETRLVNIDRDLCLIPSLAIHMIRDAKEDTSLNPQRDMLPLTGDISSKNKLINTIADTVNSAAEDILSYDLFLYNRERAAIWGLNNEYFSAPKIDDLQCAYAAIQALLNAKNERAVTAAAIFDNEEVGSETKQGAGSTFLENTLERICSAQGKSLCTAIASAMMLSADNSHAVHPNRPDKACPTNRPEMNSGVVIKYNANQRYTTDSISASLLIKILKHKHIPYQSYANRSDIPGGSTLGNISNSKVSLNTADIGMAQLAMHSCYETAGTRDTTYLIDAMTAFYGTSIINKGADRYKLLLP